MAARSFDKPRGTRDLYPEDYLQRRYITETWRRVALRHGFDEIDGPTFEHLDLYTVKSGEGIVSELFSFSRAGGDETYALRPEYTPTLARQYAARAGQLPKPTRWFSIGPYFRAERPQRGRLREFLQWNVDVLGDESFTADAELLACQAALAIDFGLDFDTVSIACNDRRITESKLKNAGVPDDKLPAALQILDAFDKLNQEELEARAAAVGLTRQQIEAAVPTFITMSEMDGDDSYIYTGDPEAQALIDRIADGLSNASGEDAFSYDPTIVRGLAYYTGLVFEMRAEGERAVAGGGRYDNLIELLGGPPTPAVGFAMGDVVLANLLEDKGLMPKGKDLLTALSRPISTRPDVFVIAGPDANEDAILQTCAQLRRGVEREGQREPWHPDRYEVPPLHARRSYKATRNVGKLLKDAAAANARFAVIIESNDEATVKDLDSGEQWSDKVALSDLAARLNAPI